MRTMRWILVMALLMAAGLTAGWAETPAATGDAQSTLAPAPGTGTGFSSDNPYAKELEKAKKDVDDALQKLLTLEQQDPFNFDAQIEAYYVYVKAEARYRTLLNLARKWEKQAQPGFSGTVLAFEKDFPILVGRETTASATAQTTGDEDLARVMPPDILRRATPVPGAIVMLRPERFIPMSTPGAQAITGTTSVRPDAIAMPRPIDPFYRMETNRKGGFKFDPIKPGRYRLTVYKLGYETFQASMEIPERGDVKRNVYLSKFKVLVGTVTTLPAPIAKRIRLSVRDNKPVNDRLLAGHKTIPVVGAAVTVLPAPIYRPGEAPSAPTTVSSGAPAAGADTAVSSDRPIGMPNPLISTKTDKKGHYELKGLHVGRYLLRVNKDGLKPFEGTLYVRGLVQTQDVVLLPNLPVPTPTPVPLPARQETEIGGPSGSSLDRPLDN